MRLSIALILLTTVIAAPQLRTPDLPPVNPLLDSEQSPLSTLRRPPPPEPEQLDDNLHDSSVSMHTYDELERFAKYSSAVYQFLCPRPLGNSLVQSVSCVARSSHVYYCSRSCLWMMFDSSLMYLRTRMDSLCVMTGDGRLLLRFGGAMSLRIWSLVRALFPSPTYDYMCVFADGNLVLIPLVSRGIEKNNTTLVHAGFLISYNSVRAVVVHVVRDQLLAFPNYTVVISGSHPLYSVPASWSPG